MTAEETELTKALLRMQKQRDELLYALKQCRTALAEFLFKNLLPRKFSQDTIPILQQADEAIANAEKSK